MSPGPNDPNFDASSHESIIKDLERYRALYQASASVFAKTDVDWSEFGSSLLDSAAALVGATGGLCLMGQHIKEELQIIASFGEAWVSDTTTLSLDDPRISNIIRHVVRNTEVYRTSPATSLLSRLESPTGSLLGETMVVPLISSSHVVIIWLIHRDLQRHFSKEDEDLLSIFVQPAMFALENISLIYRLRNSERVSTRLAQRLRALQHISSQMFDVDDSIEIYNSILDVIIEVFGFDYGVISMIQERDNLIRTQFSKTKSDQINLGWTTKSVYPLDHKDILPDTIRKNKPQVIHEWDPRLNEKIYEEFNHERLIRAYLPMRTSYGEPIGVIEVGFLKDIDRELRQHDINDLMLFASQAAAALEKKASKLRIDHLEIARKISKSLVSDLTNPKHILLQVCESIRQVFNADFVVALPFDGNRFIEHWRAIAPPEAETRLFIQDPKRTGVTAKVFEKGMYIVEDTETIIKPRFVKENEIRSFIGVRLYHEEEDLGVIYVNFVKKRKLAAEEIDLLNSIAELTSGSLRTAVGIGDLERLLDLSSNLFTGYDYEAFDIESVLQYLTTSIKDLIPNDQCIIWLLNEQGSPTLSLKAAAVSGLYAELLEKLQIAIGDGLSGLAAKERSVIVSQNVASDERAVQISGTPIDEQQTMIAAPIIFDQELLGVISVSRYELGAFRDNDIHLIQIICNIAANAIKIAELVRELRLSQQRLDSEIHITLSERGEKFAGRLFYSLVAHDVRNVLNNISALLVRLRNNSKLYSRLSNTDKRSLSDVIESISSGNKTISEFIELTSNINPRKEWIDVNQIVQRSVKLMEQRIRAYEVVLELSLENTLPDVKVNYFQIMEVLLNLISNSLKAMQITTKKRLFIQTKLSSSGKSVCISVSDTGIGIKADVKHLLFHERYSWWPEAVSGASTGIGLLNCRQIIEDEYGGEVTFESRYGQGTTFRVSIPR